VPELTFGARLALVRQKMGWNIKEAATACGLPPQSWRGWEISGREPHRKDTIAMTIATRTNVDFLWLAHGPNRGAQPAPSGRYARTRILARKAPDVQTSTPEPISQPREPLVHIRPVRQVPSISGQSRRPVGAGVL
jgi:transcriptional regulator with XRE-family HTH domain